MAAVVELHNAGGDIVDQVQIDESGRYRYHVSPGEWSLRAWDAMGHGAQGRISLSAGEDGVLDLDLQASKEGRP